MIPAIPPGSAVLGVGVDVCSVERMRHTLERTPRFAERVFTAAEREYAGGFADPGPRFAARFAAKEAVMKTMGVGIEDCPFTAIEVVRRPSGQPGIVLHGRAAELAAERGVAGVLVSIAHDGPVAMAMAVALGTAPATGSGAADRGTPPGP